MRTRIVVALAAAAALAVPAPAAAAASRSTVEHVFVAGDSTAATYAANEAPRAGWGQALPVFLGRGASVVNLALSGASSKSYVEAGLLDRILGEIRPGDYLIVSFGHNDEKTDERGTDPFTTYQDYLRLYINGARERGARPVLVTPVERRRFDATGHAVPSHGDYPEAMRQLGAAEHVPVVDLTTLSMALWDAAGVEGSKDYFLWLAPGESVNYPDGVQDNTHFQAHGAIEVARLVANGLRRMLPVVNLCRTDIPDTALTWPDVRPV
jgi:pectinesterase